MGQGIILAGFDRPARSGDLGLMGGSVGPGRTAELRLPKRRNYGSFMRMSDSLSSLTPEQINHFYNEGYVIVPNVFDPADLEPLRQAMHQAIGEKARELQSEGQLRNLHEDLPFDQQLAAIHRDSAENGETLMKHLEGMRGGGFQSREMFEVISHPQLIAAVRSLLQTTEVVASSAYRIRPKLPQIGRGIVPWHQDSGYFAEHCDTELIITCWVPLVDATVENGCMQILPRAHGGKVVRHHTGGNAGFLVIKDEDLPVDPESAVTASCPRGGVVFMTNRTPHCSTPNTSNGIRWSIDLRYQSAEVPSNADAFPQRIDEQGRADARFYEQITVACYPPEADFLVSSEKNPDKVADFETYVKRRTTYDRATAGMRGMRPWPAVEATSSP